MSVQIISTDVHLMQHVPIMMAVTHVSVLLDLVVMVSHVLVGDSVQF